MATFEEQVEHGNVKDIVIGAIMTALAFVVGFLWRDAIVATINLFVPSGEGVVYLYVSAIIGTIVVVIVAYLFVKLQRVHAPSAVKGRR